MKSLRVEHDLLRGYRAPDEIDLLGRDFAAKSRVTTAINENADKGENDPNTMYWQRLQGSHAYISV